MGFNHMLCLHPADYGHGRVACGQCTNCRINHKLRWMGRMALEQKYAFPGMPGAFLTLTYDDEHVPKNGSLFRRDLQDFMDALRRNTSRTERYFAVGEYGSQTLRPHYHVLHFGAYGNPAWAKIYNRCWKRGFIQVGSAEGAAHNYVAGYVTKKLDRTHHAAIEERGLVPEFFSCSQRPTLGSTGLTAIARQFGTEHAAIAIAEHGFPRGFNLGGRYYPFFRRDRLRVIKESGYADELAEQHLQKITERSWFYVEEMEIYRQAQALEWPPELLAAKLEQLREDQHGEATQAEIDRARARAAKFRRREAAKIRHLDS